MSSLIMPAVKNENDREGLINELIGELIKIRDQQEMMAEIDCRHRRAVACQAFAESQLPHIGDPSKDEYSDYVCRLRAKAMEQRQECEKALRVKMANDTLTKVRDNIRDADMELCAFLENIVMTVNPKLLPAIDAAL